MVDLKTEFVEKAILEVVEEVKNNLKISASISKDMSPVSIGITSQVLITLTGWLEDKLDVTIPYSCYIFFDKKKHKQLTIREAAQKLINNARNGNK